MLATTLPVERAEIVDDDDHEQDRRQLTHTCSDSHLGNIAGESQNYPNRNDPNCPMYTSRAAGDNGATCMCPYGNGGFKTSYYDDQYGSKYAWVRKYGQDSVSCAGRCGAGCNSADKEAFLDCFDHDSCVSHLGGSVVDFGGNCGDEIVRALDDYLASYGYCCCTCNPFIGCFC